MSFENREQIIKEITSNENILIDVLNEKGADIRKKKKTTAGRCIFHNGDGYNLHVFYKDDENKYKFKCHTKCGLNGDIFDLLRIKDGYDFDESISYLNDRFNLGYTLRPDKASKFENYIKTKCSTLDSFKYGLCNYENLYFYRDDDNVPVMCKIKYRSIEQPSKKEFRTYALIDKGDYYQRGTSEDFKKLKKVIYNYNKVKDSIEKGQQIFFVEGEKDADNLKKLGLIATTVYSKVNKWEKSYSEQLIDANIIFIGDTGKAGDSFRNMVVKNVLPIASSFKILNLTDIDTLGDNKDVTDWLEAGHTKEELLNIVDRTLDLKNEKELQQDDNGIYYIYIKTKIDKDTGEEYEVSRKKVYITNFKIEKANIYRSIDDDSQKIELFLISNIGKKTTILADARSLFVDLKSFRKELGIDYTFNGKGDLLPRLQMWVIKYFINKDISNFTITGIREIEGENVLITNKGILKCDGTFDTSRKAIDNNIHDIDFEGLTRLSKEEAEELISHLFNFNNKQIIYNVLGLAAGQLLNSFSSKTKLDAPPILQNIGESNSGKSKTFAIIRGLLNITSKPLSYSNLTDFTLLRAFSMTYLPLLVDELKPSKNSLHRLNMLSNHIRNLTEGYSAEKGRKDLTSIKFTYLASMMLSGEESIDEHAVINRSNISIYSRSSFTPEGEAAIDYLVRNHKGNENLRRFSLTLYTLILKKYDSKTLVDSYLEVKEMFNSITNDRVRNTAIYTMMGLIDIVDSFKILGVNTSKYIDMEEARNLIEFNLLDEVIDINGEKQVSEYEDILLLVDKLAGSSDLSVVLTHGEHYKRDGGTVAFDFNNIWDRLNVYKKHYDTKNDLMNKNTFLKQLRKSIYIIKTDDNKPTSLIRFKKSVLAKDGTMVQVSKPVRAYVLKYDKLQDLGMCNIVDMKEEDLIESDNVLKFNPPKEEKWNLEDLYTSK